MSGMITVLDQGTTLSWTETYGSPSATERLQEALRDALFSAALLGFVFGVAGFVAYEEASPVYARSAQQQRAL